MKRIFDMDDRARLPWRFFGELVDLRACRAAHPVQGQL
jgi:hypothetical protein